MNEYTLRGATDRINRAERNVDRARATGVASELAIAESEAIEAAENYAEVSCLVDANEG
jgi:hypothetical protein